MKEIKARPLDENNKEGKICIYVFLSAIFMYSCCNFYDFIE
mgnify:CR=1 FL=1